jgi:hypothetical protein
MAEAPDALRVFCSMTRCFGSDDVRQLSASRSTGALPADCDPFRLMSIAVLFDSAQADCAAGA